MQAASGMHAARLLTYVQDAGLWHQPQALGHCKAQHVVGVQLRAATTLHAGTCPWQHAGPEQKKINKEFIPQVIDRQIQTYAHVVANEQE